MPFDPGNLPDYTETRMDGEVIHDGGFLRLERDTVLTPDGKSTCRYVVRHCGAVAVIPLFANGDLLLVHQYRYPVGQHCLEIPAGKLDGKEETLACAKRELLEETGHEAQSWEKICSTFTSVGFTDEKIHMYVAHGITRGGFACPDQDEFVHPVRLSLAELRDRFAAGQVLEARTQIACLWLTLREGGMAP